MTSQLSRSQLQRVIPSDFTFMSAEAIRSMEQRTADITASRRAEVQQMNSRYHVKRIADKVIADMVILTRSAPTWSSPTRSSPKEGNIKAAIVILSAAILLNQSYECKLFLLLSKKRM